MRKIRLEHFIIALLFILAAVAAEYLKPTIKMAAKQKMELETVIPAQFGDWKMLPNQHVIELPPELAANLSRIYTETLSRTYVNSRGQQVMLSIAYGADQSDGMGVHRPEICYPAQGFVILNKKIEMGDNQHPLVRLIAKQNERMEPISYWMMIGDQRVTSNSEHKMQQIKFGLNGYIPDGLIFRVSTLDTNPEQAWKLQDQFSQQLVAGIAMPIRTRIFGY
jgi:EpsI family protein